MSTPDQPDSPQLTRRQLRELRNTASTPIITPEQAAADAAAGAEPEVEPAPAPVAPLPRAAEPVELPDAPVAAEADEEQDGGPALTRRQVRDRERLRTASVPVIDAEGPGETPEAPSDQDDATEAVHDSSASEDGVAEGGAAEEDAAEEERSAAADSAHEQAPAGDDSDALEQADSDESVETASVEAEPADETEDVQAARETPDVDVVELEVIAVEGEAGDAEPAGDRGTDGAASAGSPEGDAADEQRAAVSPTFGAGLLAGEAVEIDLPPSFDQVLGRGGGGSASPATSNALILSQTPETGAFTAPVTATGEVLVTGTFLLPDTYGSTGSAPGTADGKDIDAVLVDGELPATSSPTPIAASSAISTIKAADDIIKPPAPEKGSRLMMVLAITAGVLAVALAGVLILAFATGVL